MMDEWMGESVAGWMGGWMDGGRGRWMGRGVDGWVSISNPDRILEW